MRLNNLSYSKRDEEKEKRFRGFRRERKGKKKKRTCLEALNFTLASLQAFFTWGASFFFTVASL